MTTGKPAEDRRQFLKAAFLGSTLAAGEWLGPPAMAAGEADAPAGAPQPAADRSSPFVPAYIFLKPAEADFAEALADHMVPADSLTPAGTELGISLYIDRALAGGWGQGEGLYLGGPWQPGTPSQGYQSPMTPAQLFRAGVEATGAALRRGNFAPFAQMDAAAKDRFLHDLDEGRIELAGLDGRALFALLYQLVVEGLFADPIYGGNRDKAGWKLVGFPGVIATHSRDVATYKGRPYPVRYFGIADAS